MPTHLHAYTPADLYTYTRTHCMPNTDISLYQSMCMSIYLHPNSIQATNLLRCVYMYRYNVGMKHVGVDMCMRRYFDVYT